MGLVEHMEHAAHAGSGHDHDAPTGLGKRIGITMAMLGVLLALCSAMLGGARQSLTATMVEQNAVANRAQASSTKYRLLMAQLQQLHALLPTDPGNLKRAQADIAQLQTAMGKTAEASVVRALQLETDQILNTVTPNPADVLRFVSLAREYRAEREGADAWTESFVEAVHAHNHAAHRFEYALLAAEFGVVLCSIALLIGSRKAWLTAIVLGLFSLVAVIATTAAYVAEGHHADDKIAAAHSAFDSVRNASGKAAADEELLKDIERTQTPAAAAR
jgi:hypothetical protein